jgi:hypothetical protein
MPQQDPRAAARDRDLGLRRVGRLTWRAGLAGLGCAAVLAVAFGHHAQASTPAARHSEEPGTIVIPGSPPAPSSGGGQVTSGAS